MTGTGTKRAQGIQRRSLSPRVLSPSFWYVPTISRNVLAPSIPRGILH
jgi:hypothetical protein